MKFVAPYDPYTSFAFLSPDKLCRVVGMQGFGVGIFDQIDETCARYLNEGQETPPLAELQFMLCYMTEVGWTGICRNFDIAKSIFIESEQDICKEVLIKGFAEATRFDVITAKYDGLNFWLKNKQENTAKQDGMRSWFKPDDETKKLKYKVSRITDITQEDQQAFSSALISWTTFRALSHESYVEGYKSTGEYELPADWVEDRQKRINKCHGISLDYSRYSPFEVTVGSWLEEQ